MLLQNSAALLVLAAVTLVPLPSFGEDSLPKFIEKVPNITVTVGRDTLLPCTVEKLQGFKVAWVQVDTQTILTIHKQVITRNPRIALLHNDHRTWHLELRNVQESDRGWYMCQVNTDPMVYQQGYVDVVVPPDIIDRESSGDLTVREGMDVTLTCRAKGHPKPTIMWRREDNKNIVLDAEKSGHTVGAMGVGGEAVAATGAGAGVGGGVDEQGSRVVEGENLTLKKVSRLQMGSYLCIASNGIPPSISKRTHLRVQFPPMAWVPQQLEGAYVGQELTIECHTEAYPKSINYWTNTKGDMIVTGDRYEPIVADTTYKVYMKLRIRQVQPQDFGTFKCVAKNSLGETDGAIKVYEIEPPKSRTNILTEKESEVKGHSEGDDLRGETTPASNSAHHRDKERKKFDKYLHPKGINDLIDHLGKTYDPYPGTPRRDRQPAFGEQPDRSSTGCGPPFLSPLLVVLSSALALSRSL
ncbi:lachesin-like isoform X1 [Penaeus japonicus]|uniref:lachesin-like isoform X1 n=1 Tax=Penaeus japonicus TaxID=27405 RepID=UPI001C70CA27|nr:lachesin-like isoform X1 [Penaeus japonicus]